MKKRRVLISAGGTGGHLFPAQVVAKQLQEHSEILFVGGKLSQNAYFDKTSFDFKEIAASAISKKVWKWIPLILKGIKQSCQIIKEFKPDLIIGFGSYYTFPVLVAAKLLKIPYMLHEQNAIPGQVTKLFSKSAKLTGISFPKSEDLLKGEVRKVLFPLRKQQKIGDPYHYFGLTKDKDILLVFGGSQGAKALNGHVMHMVSLMPGRFQILHFTGNKEISEQATALYKSLGLSYCVREFEKNMVDAFSVADVVIARSGASSCFEIIEWEKPALLIPFPFAKDDHQFFNAKHFVDEVRGGFLMLQSQVTPLLLKEMVNTLLDMKEEKKKNIRDYKKKAEAKEFSEIVMKYLEKEDE